MRIRNAIFVGSVATLAMTASPVLAKNSGAPKMDDQAATSTSPACHAYQQAADGTWTQLSCQELGGAAQPQRKSATRRSDQETR